MRTSRISQETTRIFGALSPNTQRRQSSRGAKGIALFAIGNDGMVEVKDEEPIDDDNAHSSGASPSSDIEDGPQTPPRSSNKRKRGLGSITSSKVTVKGTRGIRKAPSESPQAKVKEEEFTTTTIEENPYASPSRAKAKPKIPARRTTSPSGSVRIHPPSNWEELYNIVKTMRQRNPVAPVDTMGCEDLFWQTAPPKEKRYHTLTALMLSSQTKDTVTAAAMQRLHVELVPQEPTEQGKIPKSGLTVDNILASHPKHLDSLIGKVGFHNNKTRYIQLAAKLLRDEYNSDIPDTIEGLIRLPGVGPKMAYLCMSAAWGIDEGIGVDVHVHRITNLWGWHKTKTPEETRAWLESWLPKDKWHEINKMLVGLGQLVCLPIGRRCGECDLAGTGLCKSEIRGWKATERRVKKEKLEVQENGEAVVKEEEEVKQVKTEEQLVDS